MASKSLDALRTEIRDRGEYRASFVSDSELQTLIESSLAELYDLIVDSNPDWFMKTTPQTVSVVNGTQSYALAADVYKVLGVDVLDTDGDWVTMQQFNWGERNQFQDSGAERRWARYRIMGKNIFIAPPPTWSGSVRIWYVPTHETFASGADTVEDGYPKNWEEYVVTDVLIKLADKEEKDATLLVAQKAALRERMTRLSSTRDDGEPSTVRDTYAEFGDALYPSYYAP